jgi:hypothetical protein
MFRPCKRAIVRLYFEPLWDIQREWGGYEISYNKIQVGVKYLFSYSIRVLLITFVTVVPGVLVGPVVYCGWGDADVIPARRASVSKFCLWTYVRWVRLDLWLLSVERASRLSVYLRVYSDTILGAGCPGFAVECTRFRWRMRMWCLAVIVYSLAGRRADDILYVSAHTVIKYWQHYMDC